MEQTAVMIKTHQKHKLFRDHPNHEDHLCTLVRDRKISKVADLSMEPNYYCHACGRAAGDAKNLCDPVVL